MFAKVRAVSVALVLAPFTFSFSSPVIAAPIAPNPAVDLIHRFNLRLAGNQVYRGAWDRFDRALARDTGGQVIDPLGPNNNVIAIPSAGTTAPKVLAVSPLGGAQADMFSSYQANADGTGFARVQGTAKILNNTGRLATSEGYSTVALQRGVKDRNGNVRWSPQWTFHTARTGRIGDPIDFSFLNLDDNSLLEANLFDLDMDITNGGDSSYENGDLFISASDGSFSLVMDSPYITTGTGSISISFAGGIITGVTADGIFGSLSPDLPVIGGSSMGFGFHLGDAEGAFDIGFDFGAEDNVLGYDFQGRLGGDAMIEDFLVPEPASWTLMVAGGALITRIRRNRGRMTS